MEVDKNLEEKLVSMFVIKKYRKRIIYELFHKNKRWDGVVHLHTSVFDLRQAIPLKNIRPEEHMKYLIQYGAKTKSCYMLGEDLGGDYYCYITDLDKAMYITWRNIGGMFIYCGNGIAYYKEESNLDTPDSYILVNKYYKEVSES